MQATALGKSFVLRTPLERVDCAFEVFERSRGVFIVHAYAVHGDDGTGVELSYTSTIVGLRWGSRWLAARPPHAGAAAHTPP